MSDDAPRPSIADRLTSRMGKITGLIVAVLALLTALTQLKDMFGGWFGAGPDSGPPAVVDLVQCVTAELVQEHPENDVPLSRFSTAAFRLEGTNDCGKTLIVHVAFKVSDPTPAGISFKKDCKLPDPDCWDPFPLEEGEFKKPLFQPELSVKGSHKKDLTVNVGWRIYTPDQKMVRANSALVKVRDDRPEGIGSGASS